MRIEELVARQGDEVQYIKPRDRQVVKIDHPSEEIIIRVIHQEYGHGKELIPNG